MGNEFLWDRTGSDPEIEALEAKLAVFRPSALRAPRIPAAKKVGFRFAVPAWLGAPAAAFTLLAAALLAGFAFLGSTSEAPLAVAEPASARMPVSIPESPAPSVREEQGQSAVRATDTGAQNRSRPAEGRASGLRRKTPTAKKPGRDLLAGFSDEERAAYEQLMLALSITSSSFRIVHEKLGAESSGIPLISGDETQVRSN